MQNFCTPLRSLRRSSKKISWIQLLIGLLFGSLFTICLQSLFGIQPYHTPFRLGFKTDQESEVVAHLVKSVHDSIDGGAEGEGEKQDDDAISAIHHTHAEGLNEKVKRVPSDTNELATLMYNKVRVLCWIMTAKRNSLIRAVHINATWAPRCNKYIFVSVNESLGLDLPSVDLNATEERNYLWGKTKSAFKYVYDDYDWFLKADDDTYVILENLRFMLLPYNPDEPLFFGCKYKAIVKKGYMSGGAGYVVSREGLRRFVEEALPDRKKCKERPTGAEDAEFGKCAAAVGIVAGDSRDRFGRHRMLPFGPGAHRQPGGNKTLPYWFYRNIADPYKQGEDCCSDYMVSFHYLDKKTLYSLDYLLYHVRPFALGNRDHIPEGKTGDALLQYAMEKAVYYKAPVKEPS